MASQLNPKSIGIRQQQQKQQQQQHPGQRKNNLQLAFSCIVLCSARSEENFTEDEDMMCFGGLQLIGRASQSSSQSSTAIISCISHSSQGAIFCKEQGARGEKGRWRWTGSIKCLLLFWHCFLNTLLTSSSGKEGKMLQSGTFHLWAEEKLFINFYPILLLRRQKRQSQYVGEAYLIHTKFAFR